MLKTLISNCAAKLKSWYLLARFGQISETVVATAGHGVSAEIEYRDRNSNVVGYWAYGDFDPSLPYRG